MQARDNYSKMVQEKDDAAAEYVAEASKMRDAESSLQAETAQLRELVQTLQKSNDGTSLAFICGRRV